LVRSADRSSGPRARQAGRSEACTRSRGHAIARPYDCCVVGESRRLRGLRSRARAPGAASCAPTRAEEAMREAHVPTQQPTPKQETRVSPPHVHPCGSGTAEEPAIEGSHPALRLIWRVRGPRAFRAFSTTRRFRRGPLVLTCCRASEPGPPRVAYAVGRRAGNAVDRNRIRRRLRHVVMNHAEHLHGDHQYLLGAGPTALLATQSELTETWQALLERAHRELS
jgi:ribonuclease P protein component